MEENNTKVLETQPLEIPAHVPTPPLATPEKHFSWKGAWEFIRFILMVVAIVFLVRTFIAQPFVVSGTSMVPTFGDKDYLIIDEISYRFHQPERGDVIVFHPPVDPGTYYIKRIIGIPGDTIVIKNGVVSIKNAAHPDGMILSEEYITEDANTDNHTVTVPEGQYFVMGDNRPASFDSRRWGLLDKKKIIGRAFLRLYPFSQIGVFPGEKNIE